MKKLLMLGLLYACASLSACESAEVKPTTAVAVKADKVCSTEAATGSLVQKKTICSSEDDERNGLMDTHDAISRAGLKAGGN